MNLYKKPDFGYFPTSKYLILLIVNLRKMTFPTDSMREISGGCKPSAGIGYAVYRLNDIFPSLYL
jgi:hypothetical protein